jgi:ADP-heptose:LPS heptosyltransferase
MAGVTTRTDGGTTTTDTGIIGMAAGAITEIAEARSHRDAIKRLQEASACVRGGPEVDPAELASAGAKCAVAPIIDLAPLLGDFADTAAAIAQLDLVLMTDSAVVHLAGAMGKSVWVLLGFVSHWQWLLDRADSPWYPTVRLFRQRSWGDWTGAFDRAAAELLKQITAGGLPASPL